ncbi:MAG: hypothetical protein ACXIUB_00500 [Wenzhouxiangella sp.]
MQRTLWISTLCAGLMLAGGALASGFDRATFESLDREKLRAVEDRIHELLEPGTARALREPRSPEEAYVIARQQRLAAAMQAPAETIKLADGGVAQGHLWQNARATRVSVGPDGRLRTECVSASEMLGHQPPDFRLGNRPSEVVR